MVGRTPVTKIWAVFLVIFRPSYAILNHKSQELQTVVILGVGFACRHILFLLTENCLRKHYKNLAYANLGKQQKSVVFRAVNSGWKFFFRTLFEVLTNIWANVWKELHVLNKLRTQWRANALKNGRCPECFLTQFFVSKSI